MFAVLIRPLIRPRLIRTTPSCSKLFSNRWTVLTERPALCAIKAFAAVKVSLPLSLANSLSATYRLRALACWSDSPRVSVSIVKTSLCCQHHGASLICLSLISSLTCIRWFSYFRRCCFPVAAANFSLGELGHWRRNRFSSSIGKSKCRRQRFGLSKPRWMSRSIVGTDSPPRYWRAPLSFRAPG